MDLVHLKMKVLLLLSVFLLARGSPIAMLQHATSSQSIVFHQSQAATSPVPLASQSSGDQYSGPQPKYEYKYEVSDHQTGDRKSHWESREGDKVRGAYTLYEPDGALRTVEYTADAVHGFNAVVRRDETTKHQHRRPLDSYSNLAANTVTHDGYDATASQSRYAAERGGYQNGADDLAHHSGSGASYGPGVGFSVDHGTGFKSY